MKLKTIKTISFIVALLAISIACFWACENSSEQNETIFIASGHPDWAPIMYKDGDLISGAGPKIVTELFKEMGLKVSIKYSGSWDVVQEKTKNGEIDLIVGIYKTQSREINLNYLDTFYTKDPVAIFVKKGNIFTFANWDELIGKKGVVTKGDSYGQEFDKFIKEKLNVTEVTTPDEAFALLTENKADYFVYALYSGKKVLADKNLKEQIEFLSNYVTTEDFYIAISKKSALSNRLEEFNKILKKKIADGTVEQILKEYEK
jgi:polar amino acid transport system substrate-binding protein